MSTVNLQPQPEDPRLGELSDRTAAMLNAGAVDPDVVLNELGIDSLNVVELIMICEQIYPGVLDPDALKLDNFTTLRDLHTQLAALSC